MMKKIAATILRVFLVLLFIYNIVDIAASVVNDRKDFDGVRFIIVILYFFVSLILSWQINVLLLIILLVYGLFPVHRTAIFNRKMLAIFVLNMLGVFIHAYSMLNKLLEGSQFTERAHSYYGLNHTWIARHNFLSDTYLIYGLGWYKIKDFFNIIFHSVYGNGFEQEDQLLIVSANCCLSTLLLIFFLCFFIRRRR